MIIGGLQKTTVIDFPGRLACTVFTVGCNFRCPFCHNKDLLSRELFKKSKLQLLKEDDFFTFLEKRKKILDGVCITGGEPTLQTDLVNFCGQIKLLGLEVKLDTNGTNLEILNELITKKLIDFVAMDVKTVFNDYKKAIGVNFPINKVKQSLKLIWQSGLPNELRTTVVPGIHNEESILKLARELANFSLKLNQPINKINYFLQQFRPQNCLSKKFLRVEPFSEKQIKNILRSVVKILPNTGLRGVD